MKTPKTPFDQAADTFVNAFKSSVHLQEETARKCFDLVKSWSESEDWAKHYKEFVEQAVPSMQATTENAMKLWEENSRKCMELLGEGFAAVQTTSPTEAQNRLRSLWEKNLDAMRENTEAVIKLSREAMQAYADYMKDLVPAPAESATA